MVTPTITAKIPRIWTDERDSPRMSHTNRAVPRGERLKVTFISKAEIDLYAWLYRKYANAVLTVASQAMMSHAF